MTSATGLGGLTSAGTVQVNASAFAAGVGAASIPALQIAKTIGTGGTRPFTLSFPALASLGPGATAINVSGTDTVLNVPSISTVGSLTFSAPGNGTALNASGPIGVTGILSVDGTPAGESASISVGSVGEEVSMIGNVGQVQVAAGAVGRLRFLCNRQLALNHTLARSPASSASRTTSASPISRRRPGPPGSSPRDFPRIFGNATAGTPAC